MLQAGQIGPYASKSKEGFDRVFLNSSLVAWGLALPDTVEAPKLPDNIAKWDSLAEAAQQAKSKGFYIYGSVRDPTIDEVIAAGIAAHPAN
jgi:hypothetical protein